MKTCPACGSPMRLRTAHRGPNAGSQFWGCSRYPACKEIVEFTPTGPDGDPSIQTPSPPAAPRAFPVHAAAAPRAGQGQSAFFQACGLPAAFVESLHMAGADRSLLRAVAQWRLDLPLPHSEGVPPEDRNVIAVAESLLTRGTTPLCSQSLERALGAAAVPPDDAKPVIEAVRRVAFVPSCRFRSLRFDSPEEGAVFEWVLTLVEREGLPWSLVPQIELASISPAIDPPTAERGDLLLVHAEGAPILVEVDGAQHDAHGERDEGRDRELNEAGVRIVRVPASEARDGRGPNLDMLKQILLDGRRDLPSETELSRIVRWCKYFHQLQLSLLAALRGAWLRLDAPWCIGVALPAQLRGDPQAAAIIPLAVADLLELLGRLGRLLDRPLPAREPRVTIVGDAAVDHELDVLVGQVKALYARWHRRELKEDALVILYRDAIALRVRLDRQVVSVPVLVALAVRTDGQKVVLDLEALTSESTTAWGGFLESLIARGLRRPQLCVIDGNAGLRAALETSWPGIAVPRCVVHKLRTRERHAPRHARAELTADYHRMVEAESGALARQVSHASWPSGRNGCPRSPPACARPARNCSRSITCRPVGGSRRGPPTQLNGSMASSAGASRYKGCCQPRRPPRGCWMGCC